MPDFAIAAAEMAALLGPERPLHSAWHDVDGCRPGSRARRRRSFRFQRAQRFREVSAFPLNILVATAANDS
jgi:hypothetical protein